MCQCLNVYFLFASVFVVVEHFSIVVWLVLSKRTFVLLPPQLHQTVNFAESVWQHWKANLYYFKLYNLSAALGISSRRVRSTSYELEFVSSWLLIQPLIFGLSPQMEGYVQVLVVWALNSTANNWSLHTEKKRSLLMKTQFQKSCVITWKVSKNRMQWLRCLMPYLAIKDASHIFNKTGSLVENGVQNVYRCSLIINSMWSLRAHSSAFYLTVV